MELTLTVTSPQAETMPEPSRVLVEGRLVAGRDEACDWVLPDRGVSRQHFQVDCREDGFFITDLSSFGTAVDDQPLEGRGATRLRDGSFVQAGPVSISVGIRSPAGDQTVAEGAPRFDAGPSVPDADEAFPAGVVFGLMTYGLDPFDKVVGKGSPEPAAPQGGSRERPGGSPSSPGNAHVTPPEPEAPAPPPTPGTSELAAAVQRIRNRRLGQDNGEAPRREAQPDSHARVEAQGDGVCEPRCAQLAGEPCEARGSPKLDERVGQDGKVHG